MPRPRSRTPQGSTAHPQARASRPQRYVAPAVRSVAHAATWTTLSGDTSVGFVSHRRWRDQPRPLRDDPVALVPEPFKGLTLQDRHPTEPPAVYTPEEMARLCPLCHVIQFHPATHRASPLHLNRALQPPPAPAINPGPQDIEAALALVRRFRPHLLSPAGPRDELILDVPDLPDM
ncbi:uncharacterized protein LOC135398025 [Ornithodoros turicata]|uniref:uncharacterized protein LOC135398025 n=1 Tax=Ornithodoros turicata TaxID=34597 RepID=UPI003138DF3C